MKIPWLGIRVVKSFANEDIESEKFEDGNGKFLDTKKMSYFYMAGFQTANRAFEGIMYLVVVVAGSIFMIKGHISPADLTAYLLYVSTLLLRFVLLFNLRSVSERNNGDRAFSRNYGCQL